MKPTLLIVDDEAVNIDMIYGLLNTRFAIKVAFDGEQALRIAAEVLPDMILLDVYMPGIDGYETCRSLKADPKTEAIPVIFLTARTDEASIEKGYAVGGADYVTKPFKARELMIRIERELKLNTLIRDLEAQVAQEVRRNLLREKQLIQQSKMAETGDMMGALIHQWKQPLNAIAVATQTLWLKNGKRDTPEPFVETFCSRVMENVDFMTETMEDFRTFFKPSQQKAIFIPCHKVEKVQTMFHNLFKKSNVEIVILSHQCFDVSGYPTEFMQVILNLFTNAREAIVQNGTAAGRIECDFEQTEATDIIRIRDNGGGIDTALLPDKLFDEYTSTKGDKGTGIGLKICKNIIENRHGGRIRASNSGDGAEFVIELPRTVFGPPRV